MSSREQRGGGDLGPLPFESSTSVLLRFAWRNALNAKRLRECIDGKRMNVKPNLYRLDWLKGNAVARCAGWNFPSADELSFCTGLKGMESSFLSRTLRFCPICFQASYHTFWHQFLAVYSCPIHGCELVTRCQCCNAHAPTYEFSAILFNKPYVCTECHSLLFGADLRLEAHLDVRDQVKLLETRLKPLTDWISHARPVLDTLRHLNIAHGNSFTRLDNWTHSSLFPLNILAKAAPCAAVNLVLPCSPISALSWRINMLRTHSDQYFDRRARNGRENTAIAVYKATLRGLRTWLLSEELVRKSCASKLLIVENGLVQLEGWDSRALAYQLMRAVLETYEPEPMTNVPTVFGLRHDHLGAIYSFEGRQPRLARRAIYLAVFAAMYWTVEKARKWQRIEIRKLRVPIESTIAMVLSAGEGTDLVGMVIFPTIPGLPINPFTKTRVGIDMIFDSQG